MLHMLYCNICYIKLNQIVYYIILHYIYIHVCLKMVSPLENQE